MPRAPKPPKDTLTKLQRLDIEISEVAASCRGWAQIEGRLTDKERAEKTALFDRAHALDLRRAKLVAAEALAA